MKTRMTHKDLDVWQVAMDLVVVIYDLTRRLPYSERFGLVPQMRRAAVSVPSNIAEGAARGSRAEFARFLTIAKGSLAELETQLILLDTLNLCRVEGQIQLQISRVRKMLVGLIGKLLR